MSSDDCGRDLSAVEALRRKQDALERDMTAVKQKVFEHENDAVQARRDTGRLDTGTSNETKGGGDARLGHSSNETKGDGDALAGHSSNEATNKTTNEKK